MGIEHTQRQETDPMVDFERVKGSFRNETKALDDLLDSRGSTLSPEVRAAIDDLQRNMHQPFEPYTS